MTDMEQRSLILREENDLTISERSLINRGLALAETLGNKEYVCPIPKDSFVLIPAGTFMMGSPEDEPMRNDNEMLHQVTISRSFYMQATLVTQGQWKKVMGSSFNGDENLPVEQVSWNDVHEFIRRLNQQEEMDKYRLPTESEWEYACRAGSTTAYCFGNGTGNLGEYAWYYDNIEGNATHPVGQKKPNAWGLYDMHGNVWEWVEDGYEKYQSRPVTDPVGSPPGPRQLRVLRGGCWRLYARGCRSATRTVGGPRGEGNLGIGFRLVMTCPIPQISQSPILPRDNHAFFAKSHGYWDYSDPLIPIMAMLSSQNERDALRKAIYHLSTDEFLYALCGNKEKQIKYGLNIISEDNRYKIVETVEKRGVDSNHYFDEVSIASDECYLSMGGDYTTLFARRRGNEIGYRCVVNGETIRESLLDHYLSLYEVPEYLGFDMDYEDEYAIEEIIEKQKTKLLKDVHTRDSIRMLIYDYYLKGWSIESEFYPLQEYIFGIWTDSIEKKLQTAIQALR